MTKISVVMPVYNAESCLGRAIDSVLNQTFREWELICVDDGSTDASPAICDSYAKNHANVRVIHKSNEGVSAARQMGVEAAIGEYVIHVDSDDWVEPTMMAELYAKAQETNADVVICDFFTDTQTGQKYVEQKPTDCKAETVLRELFQQLHGSCWNKLVRRVCYSNYNISFPEGLNFCEDLITWVKLLSHEDVKIAYLPKAYYHYVYNEHSITQAYSYEKYLETRRIVAYIEELYPNNKDKATIVNRWKMNIKFASFWGAKVFTPEEYRSIYPECNGLIMSMETSMINRLLMRTSYIPGFFYFSTRFFSFKNYLSGHNNYK